MKKTYEVTTYKTNEDGRRIYKEVEYIHTENIMEYVERKKLEIENVGYWWMDHERMDGRPYITVKEIEIKEV